MSCKRLPVALLRVEMTVADSTPSRHLEDGLPKLQCGPAVLDYELAADGFEPVLQVLHSEAQK